MCFFLLKKQELNNIMNNNLLLITSTVNCKVLLIGLNNEKSRLNIILKEYCTISIYSCFQLNI
jgi:hypothetical protein